MWKFCQSNFAVASLHFNFESDKELRIANLNYAERQLVGTTVTAYVAGSSITTSKACARAAFFIRRINEIHYDSTCASGP